MSRTRKYYDIDNNKNILNSKKNKLYKRNYKDWKMKIKQYKGKQGDNE